MVVDVEKGMGLDVEKVGMMELETRGEEHEVGIGLSSGHRGNHVAYPTLSRISSPPNPRPCPPTINPSLYLEYDKMVV